MRGRYAVGTRVTVPTNYGGRLIPLGREPRTEGTVTARGYYLMTVRTDDGEELEYHPEYLRLADEARSQGGGE